MKQKAFLKGFTLLELMVALAIFALLVSAGLPGVQILFDNMSADTASKQFVNALNYARGEAVANGKIVRVCPGSEEGSCTGDGLSWSSGWRVYVDVNDNEGFEDDELVKVNNTRESRATLSGDAAQAVDFDVQGFAEAEMSFDVYCRSNSSVPSRVITISESGAVNVSGERSCPSS